MGLRIRKSIKLGKHLRLNLSKSGVSVSGGIKGARVSLNSKGTIRKSVGVPGTGIYFQDQHKINTNVNRIEKVKTKKVYTPSNSKKVRLIPAFIICAVLSGLTNGIGMLIFIGCLIYNNGVNKGKW